MFRKPFNLKHWIRVGYAGIVLSLFASFGYVTPARPFFALKAPIPSIGDLASVNPASSAMMDLRQRQAEQKGLSLHLRHQWVPLSRVSPTLINAVIAAEDSTFYYHHGVEWGLTRDVMLETLRTGRKDRGASTITQQVARNLYLSPKKTYFRKIKEIVLAQRLEQTLSKNRILEIYLNIAEWGEGIFGVESAAQTFYGKSAADLTWDEAVGLAAVLPSPRRHHPTDASRWVTLRKDWVVQRLLATGRYAPDVDLPEESDEDPVDIPPL